jgi:LytS/YehU family sensor histidine kinase
LIGSRPKEAREMVQQLSDFLRTTLRKDEQQWIKLEDEMHSLQLYLTIEKVRFGHRLFTELDLEEDALKMQLPALLLQPLVENAIKFGLYDTTEESRIYLTAKSENAQLVITVENPFDPSTAAAQKGTGFGLSSVQRRLYLMFGRHDLLQTTVKENIFSTTVIIPQPIVSGFSKTV